jgi:hypothetical protein
MLRWIKSYIGWARIWLGLRPWHYRAYPFAKCPDCAKRMCLSAHYNCIPF